MLVRIKPWFATECPSLESATFKSCIGFWLPPNVSTKARQSLHSKTGCYKLGQEKSSGTPPSVAMMGTPTTKIYKMDSHPQWLQNDTRISESWTKKITTKSLWGSVESILQKSLQNVSEKYNHDCATTCISQIFAVGLRQQFKSKCAFQVIPSTVCSQVDPAVKMRTGIHYKCIIRL